MTNNSNDIGFYFIQSALLENFSKTKQQEIANLIVSLDFDESINKLSINGEIVVLDSLNLFNRFPLLGEELLTISIEDFFGKTTDMIFWVYAVESISPNYQSTNSAYRLKVCSVEVLYSESKRISRSVSGTVDQISQQIFQEFFPDTKKTFEVSQTDNLVELVLPSKSVMQTLYFLCRKAFSSNSKTNDFYLFENRKGFFMKSFDDLVENPITETPLSLQYDSGVLENFSDFERQMNNVMNISFPKSIDTINDLKTGSMISHSIELDVINRMANTKTFDYNQEFDSFPKLDEQRLHHSDDFQQQFFSDDNISRIHMFVTDSSKQPEHYIDIVQPKSVNRNRLSSNICVCRIHGKNDLYCGQIVDLNIVEFEVATDKRELNKSLSGKYLIHTIKHSMQEKKYQAILTLVKVAPKGINKDLSGDSNV